MGAMYSLSDSKEEIMEVLTPVNVVRAPRHHEGRITVGLPDPSYRAFELLYFGAMLTAFCAGIGKVFGVFAFWERFVPEFALNLAGIYLNQWVRGLGLWELALAALIAVRPRLGGWLSAAWLGVLIIDVIAVTEQYALAGCLGMMGIAACALAFLAEEFGPKPETPVLNGLTRQ